MKHSRIISLVTVLTFVFSVLAPAPLAAAEAAHTAEKVAAEKVASERKNLVQRVKAFSIRDWRRTKQDVRAVGDFLKRDWQRTKEDMKSLKARGAKLRRSLFGRRKDDAEAKFESLRGKLLDCVGSAIDEVGPAKFRSAAQEASGKDLVTGGKSDPRLLRGAILRSVERAFTRVAQHLMNGKHAEIERALAGAEEVVGQIQAGATEEQVVSRLKAKAFGDGTGPKAPSKTRAVFKAIWKVFRTLFFCAALGAIGWVSVGVIAYGITAEVFAFTAVGGALIIACLAGVIVYIARCIKDLKSSPKLETAPVGGEVR